MSITKNIPSVLRELTCSFCNRPWIVSSRTDPTNYICPECAAGRDFKHIDRKERKKKRAASNKANG